MCSPHPDDLKADGGFKRNNTKAAMPGRLLRAGVVAGQRRRCQRWQTALKLCSFTLIIVQSISVLPQDAQACTLLTTPQASLLALQQSPSHKPPQRFAPFGPCLSFVNVISVPVPLTVSTSSAWGPPKGSRAFLVAATGSYMLHWPN